jgi:hypothetical protein
MMVGLGAVVGDDGDEGVLMPMKSRRLEMTWYIVDDG